MLTAARAPLWVIRYAGAVLAAGRRITWPIVAGTLAIAVVLEIWFGFQLAFDVAVDTSVPAAQVGVSGAIVNLSMATFVMFLTLVADEMVARGSKRRLAYSLAVVTGCAMAALVQWEVHRLLHVPLRFDGGVRHEPPILQPASVFFEYLIWASIIVFIYVNRRAALMAMARMNSAQVAQARARRRTLESRLQALQARVEPQFLFNTLVQVRDLYESEPAKGARMLDELIVYLRAALPHLREPSSTLGREMDLVGAFLAIVRMRLGERLGFDIDISTATPLVIVPSMMVLPLVEHVLACGLARSVVGGSIRITACSSEGMLHIEITGRGEDLSASDAAGVFDDIRDRLRALYADRAALRVALPSDNEMDIILHIPHEATDGDHR